MIKQLLSVVRFLPVLLLCLGLSAFAQERKVSGKIISSDDATGVPGVNVLEKGTTNGTVSDADGNYTVNVGNNATLVFSAVGFATQEVAVGTQSTIDITLVTDVTSLSEVVVVGYGTQEKKEISSAVSSIKTEDFNKGTVNDPMQLLAGKVAGLNITRPGGDPNGGFNIRLRGIGTIGANSEPLIVIDGVIGGSLSTVDPNDIASIDVLKDGSAAAIYGTRGGTGVILITTKSGKSGKPMVNYNGSYAVEQIANTIDFMNADEFVDAGGTDLGSDTDWLDIVTRNGNAMVHNLSLGGGSDKTTYYAAINYRKAEGIAINSGFDQLNARINFTQKALKDRATFTLGYTTTKRESEYGFKESLRYAIVANPTMPVYDNTTTSPTAGGNFGGYAQRDIFDFFNPLAIAEQNQNDGKDHRTLISLRGEYDFEDFIPGLRAAVSYSNQTESEIRGYYYSKFSKFRGSGRNGLAGRSELQRSFDLFETTLNYDKSFGNTNLALLGGYSYQDFFEEGFAAQGGNFLTDQYGYNNLFAALDFRYGLGQVGSYAASNKLVGFFGRANVSINNAFFFSASYRHEGSSRFGSGSKWGGFPAASAAVTLTNLFDIPAVSNLKVRASYGRTGNRPNSSYLSLERVGPAGTFFYNGRWIDSYGPTSNPNPDLAWETKDEYDFGLDLAVFNNKLTATFDYYTRKTTDLLYYAAVPVPPNLVGNTWKNVGELNNSGMELALNYNVIKKEKFSYTTGANFATYKTEIVKLGPTFYTAGMGAPGQNAFTLARIKEGEEFGQLWGPKYNGVNSDGTYNLEDLDGSGGSDGGYCNCDDDKFVMGNGLPKFTMGWNNSLSYGAFDLNFFLRGAFGHSLLNSYRGFYENREGTTLNNYNIVKTEFYDPAVTKAEVNSYHVEKASFVRLDNATLGYNFNLKPGSLITKLRMYVSGQNLFTITDYTGIDPEVRYVDQVDGDGGGGVGAIDPFAPGIERRSTYFTTRTFTIGFNLGF
jgi:iron complex outermembrane receptor protein